MAALTVGSRVRLDALDDPWDRLPPGSWGTCVAVTDDTASVAWDNGADLDLAPWDYFTVTT